MMHALVDEKRRQELRDAVRAGRAIQFRSSKAAAERLPEDIGITGRTSMTYDDLAHSNHPPEMRGEGYKSIHLDFPTSADSLRPGFEISLGGTPFTSVRRTVSAKALAARRVPENIGFPVHMGGDNAGKPIELTPSRFRELLKGLARGDLSVLGRTCSAEALLAGEEREHIKYPQSAGDNQAAQQSCDEKGGK